ncbi:MAG: undecaprenyldiphospho-muramoylpentapeptide beta-N-acetylglucosaminyltransferase [Candidatus Zixiibacteriota bacterium]|nr:MAG: undecaprenyldiphospho-muramoylpentapeptide beta-N-acetylglucosaminyltransferase [candidate division Zixibacteria bacterium]
MNMDSVKIIFAGGGTGGHLYPAIAIADKIKELLANKVEAEILFIGTKRGLEYRIKDKLNYPLETLSIRGIARSFTLKNLLVPFAIISSLWKMNSIMNRFKPDLVVGTGGYVCWPVVSTAYRKKIPAVLQEQNSYPGLSVRKLASKVQKIYLGFERAKDWFKTDAEIIVTGNPIRSDISKGDSVKTLQRQNLSLEKKTILILGGSQGARAINDSVLRSLKNENIKDGYQILWQTGKRGYTDVTNQLGNKANCSLFPFAHDMHNIYATADLVIARAGALTLAELIACKLPSILIPYPFAAGEHQKKNAQFLVDSKMAIMVEEKDLDQTDIIKKAVSTLSSDEHNSIKKNLENYIAGKKPAVDLIAEDIIEIINKNKLAEKKIAS